MGFQANKDDFDASTYVKVNERLKQFRDQYPNGSIITERVRENGGVIYRAIIFRDINDCKPASTGHAYLPDTMKGEKVEEYCETVSLGRGLAILGFKVEKSIASAEEMQQFERQKESQKKCEDCAGDCDCAKLEEEFKTVATDSTPVAGEPPKEEPKPAEEPKMKLATKFAPRSRFRKA